MEGGEAIPRDRGLERLVNQPERDASRQYGTSRTPRQAPAAPRAHRAARIGIGRVGNPPAVLAAELERAGEPRLERVIRGLEPERRRIDTDPSPLPESSASS